MKKSIREIRAYTTKEKDNAQNRLVKRKTKKTTKGKMREKVVTVTETP